jgi:hypothetical protein
MDADIWKSPNAAEETQLTHAIASKKLFFRRRSSLVSGNARPTKNDF